MSLLVTEQRSLDRGLGEWEFTGTVLLQRRQSQPESTAVAVTLLAGSGRSHPQTATRCSPASLPLLLSHSKPKHKDISCAGLSPTALTAPSVLCAQQPSHPDTDAFTGIPCSAHSIGPSSYSQASHCAYHVPSPCRSPSSSTSHFTALHLRSGDRFSFSILTKSCLNNLQPP